MVGEALKGGRLIAEVFSKRGYDVFPGISASPSDMLSSYITAVRLGAAEPMQAFCQTVQLASPVGSYVQPVPGISAALCCRR